MGVYETTIGPFLIGIIINSYLYGIVTHQFALYCQTKFNDRLATKCMVVFLFILDTFNSAVIVYMGWIVLVLNYDNPPASNKREWAYIVTPICTGITAMVVQMYLGHRIWRLTNRKFLYAIVIVLAIVSCGLGIAVGVQLWFIGVMTNISQTYPLFVSWLATQVAVDVFISVTLVIIFARSRTGLRRTDSVLNRLIRLAIQTGVFVTIFALGDLITSVTLCPRKDFNGPFAFPAPRTYTITLLDSLLARQSLKTDLYATYQLGSLNWVTTGESQGTSESQSAGDQRDVKKTLQDVEASNLSMRENMPSIVVPSSA